MSYICFEIQFVTLKSFLIFSLLVKASPGNFIAGRPKAALLVFFVFFLVISDVARCYLWLFSLFINIKIGKNSC